MRNCWSQFFGNFNGNIPRNSRRLSIHFRSIFCHFTASISFNQLQPIVSHYSPYVFAMSHENRATPLKVSQRRPCRTCLVGVSHLNCALYRSYNCVALQGVSQLQCRESRYTAPLSNQNVCFSWVSRREEKLFNPPPLRVNPCVQILRIIMSVP